MEIKVYRWNDRRIDIYGLMEFASISKLNMIKTFDIILSLGKRFPDIDIGFYHIDMAKGLNAKTIDINGDVSASQVFDGIEDLMAPGFVKVKIINEDDGTLNAMKVFGLLDKDLGHDFTVGRENDPDGFIKLRVASKDKTHFLSVQEVFDTLREKIPFDDILVKKI